MALPELTRDDVSPELAEIVDYRKSGLSLNHIVGCPLDCAYCVRHIFDNFQMRIPHRLLSDESAVEALLSSRYFRAHRTPLQILNRATDPLLPAVKPAVFKVLQALDARGLTNHVLVISRYRFGVDEAAILNELRRLRVTLLFTWSGIEDRRIEPVSSKIAAQSMRRAYELAKRYRVVQYWRPLVHGLNDTDALLQTARENARNVHATAFTGLFFRREIETFYRSHGLSLLYTKTARRKILPEVLERRVLAAFEHAPLFRKTSCAVAFAHGEADYNGHACLEELCDICPNEQLERCRSALKSPTKNQVEALAREIDAPLVIESIEDRAVNVSGSTEQDRYFIQHALNHQIHDVAYPHHRGRHGRAEIGWSSDG